VHFTLEQASLRKREATVSVGGGQPVHEWTGEHFVEKPFDIR